MYIYLSQEKLNHPFDRLIELKEVELKKELKSWSRLDLIKWLSWFLGFEVTIKDFKNNSKNI